MIPTSSFIQCTCIVLFSACVVNTNKKFVDNIDFRDTLLNTYILSVDNGDTVLEFDKIFFTPIDPAIDTSGFLYDVCNPPCLNKDVYKVYFPTEKVIAFCDSMLTILSRHKNQNDLNIFNKKYSYEHLKEQVEKHKMEIMDGYEMEILFDRFNPLILNPITRDKPKYIIVKHRIVKQENLITTDMKTYDIKNKFGDTINLAIRIGDVQLKIPANCCGNSIDTSKSNTVQH